VIVLPSIGNGGALSRIVPMVTHVDQTEHTVDVVVTERGLADLRGLAPVERAREIIDNCVHPEYQPFLRQYLAEAVRGAGGHQPHDLERAFKLHVCYRQKGDMRLAFH